MIFVFLNNMNCDRFGGIAFLHLIFSPSFLTKLQQRVHYWASKNMVNILGGPEIVSTRLSTRSRTIFSKIYRERKKTYVSSTETAQPPSRS